MRLTKIAEMLKRFPLLPYIEQVHANGRQAIDSDMRKQASLLYDIADSILSFDTSLDKYSRATLNLVKDVLYSEKFLSENSKPRYVAYANLRLLDRYLLEGQTATLARKWAVAKQALALIVRDWHERELERMRVYLSGALDPTLLGYEKKEVVDPIAHIKERERSLASLSQFSAVEGLSDTRIILNEVHIHATDWSYFAREPAKQITHLTCMPRSRWHDEYMFLRTIHATECCFSGILVGLAALPPFIRRREFAAATEVLKGTLFFSDFLIKLFAIFTTMPVDHFFNGFREATGDGSAIQSIRFQTLEVLTRGLGPPKRTALSPQPEVGFTSSWQPPKDATLLGMCEEAAISQDGGEEFLEIAALLDRDLYKWRTRHLGIARKYLPSNAVGTGNEGVAYLEANYRSPRSAPEALEYSDDRDLHMDKQIARCTLSWGLGPGGAPPVAVLRASNIVSSKVEAAKEELTSRLGRVLSERSDAIGNSIDSYKRFFQSRVYPVGQQLETYRRKRSLPSAPVPALLLSLELQSGSLFGVHDLSNIAGQIVFDTASADESFMGLGGKLVKCAAGELIVRDEHGIIASLFQGPDRRSAATLHSDRKEFSWAFVLFGYPSMPTAEFDRALKDAQETVTLIGATEEELWISYAH